MDNLFIATVLLKGDEMQIKKYSLTVFGCQMNERDAETLRGFLDEMGYEETASAGDADLVILNTCAVREKAEQKVFGHIGRLGLLKQKKPDMLIAVCGCMVQQKAVAAKIKKRYPFVNLVFGTYNLAAFPELLKQAQERGETVVSLLAQAGGIEEELPVSRQDNYRAWVNITYGCNNFCSYCIVPYVRGRERSRKSADIIREVKGLSDRGFIEITLLGQNVNSYGKDLPGETDFAGLLARIDKETGIKRIRFTTSHPRDFTEKLVRTIAEGKNICEHVHLPVQAGSNRILKLMNRGYTREHYLDLAAMLRSYIPGCSITTDIIVGFPGETDEDFADTLDLVDKVSFDAAFTFMYSRRPGTPAAEMQDQIPLELKKERFRKLVNLQNSHSLRHNQALLGKTVEVLVEGPSKTNPAVWTGKTSTNKTVNFTGENIRKGILLPVQITEAKTWSLTGRTGFEQRNADD